MAEHFLRRPYAGMYEFLIDEFTAHLARAIQERLNDHMEAATEALRDAQQALSIFSCSLKNTTPIGRRLNGCYGI